MNITKSPMNTSGTLTAKASGTDDILSFDIVHVISPPHLSFGGFTETQKRSLTIYLTGVETSGQYDIGIAGQDKIIAIYIITDPEGTKVARSVSGSIDIKIDHEKEHIHGTFYFAAEIPIPQGSPEKVTISNGHFDLTGYDQKNQTSATGSLISTISGGEEEEEDLVSDHVTLWPNSCSGSQGHRRTVYFEFRSDISDGQYSLRPGIPDRVITQFTRVADDDTFKTYRPLEGVIDLSYDRERENIKGKFSYTAHSIEDPVGVNIELDGSFDITGYPRP